MKKTLSVIGVICIVWFSTAYSEAPDAPFLQTIAKTLSLRVPTPENAGGAVALYQSLFTASALLPHDNETSLLGRVSACKIVPQHVEQDEEGIIISFSDLYSIVFQGKPFQTGNIRLHCLDFDICIPIRVDYSVATLLSAEAAPSTVAIEQFTPSLFHTATYDDLNEIYTTQFSLSDAEEQEYFYLSSACIEFMQIAKLTAFLYPGMPWNEFVRIAEEMGISTHSTFSDGVWTWTTSPINTGDLLYKTTWANSRLQVANISMNPSIVTTTSPVMNIFVSANENEEVLIYCPCVFVDLFNTWRCKIIDIASLKK